jgi:ferredoxin-NADP reductase
MFGFFLRAIRHPVDYGTMFNKRTLILQEVIRESTDSYSFIFKPETTCIWKAGQHGIFYFPDKKVTGITWRAFSVASSTLEGVIRITTIIKDSPSDFKKHLLFLKQGDTIKMNGPFGEFHTQPNIKQIVGIAGGVGITPFRAIIKELSLGAIPNTKLTLIYSAVGTHTFKKEFDQLVRHPDIEIIYTTTAEEVNKSLEIQVAKHRNNASYFVSGSPGMICAIRKSLREKEIAHVVSDPFKGY